MGIKDYMVASGVSAVTAQRLVRKICPFCKTEYKAVAKEILDFGFPEEIVKLYTGLDDLNAEITLYKGTGCKHCKNTGYLGRTVLGEVLIITEEIADLIVKGATPLTIKNKAKEQGMRTIKEDGLLKALKGITTLEEVKRVTG